MPYILQEWNSSFTRFDTIAEYGDWPKAEEGVCDWRREFKGEVGRTPEAGKDWRMLEVVTSEFDVPSIEDVRGGAGGSEGGGVTIHDLKTWPEYFEAVRQGNKDFEVRRDDRGFEFGDLLVLREWDNANSEYTGRSILRLVHSVFRDVPGLREGFVVMGIKEAV